MIYKLMMLLARLYYILFSKEEYPLEIVCRKVVLLLLQLCVLLAHLRGLRSDDKV